MKMNYAIWNKAIVYYDVGYYNTGTGWDSHTK